MQRNDDLMITFEMLPWVKLSTSHVNQFHYIINVTARNTEIFKCRRSSVLLAVDIQGRIEALKV